MTEELLEVFKTKCAQVANKLVNKNLIGGVWTEENNEDKNELYNKLLIWSLESLSKKVDTNTSGWRNYIYKCLLRRGGQIRKRSARRATLASREDKHNICTSSDLEPIEILVCIEEQILSGKFNGKSVAIKRAKELLNGLRDELGEAYTARINKAVDLLNDTLCAIQ